MTQWSIIISSSNENSRLAVMQKQQEKKYKCKVFDMLFKECLQMRTLHSGVKCFINHPGNNYFQQAMKYIAFRKIQAIFLIFDLQENAPSPSRIHKIVYMLLLKKICNTKHCCLCSVVFGTAILCLVKIISQSKNQVFSS